MRPNDMPRPFAPEHSEGAAMGDLIESLKGLQEWKPAAHKNRSVRDGSTAYMTKKRATGEGEEVGLCKPRRCDATREGYSRRTRPPARGGT